MPDVTPTELELSPEQEAALISQLEQQLAPALEALKKRQERLAKLRRMYKAKPQHERKSYPWPGASNVVIPIVGTTVDGIVARLMRSFLGMPEPVEAKILAKEAQGLPEEKDFRDWATMWMKKSGARDTFRTAFHDSALDGTVFAKVRWDSNVRAVDAYDASTGQITHTDVVDYEGPVVDAVPADDVVWPEGFGEWKRLPWVGHLLRLTWQELKTAEAQGMYYDIDDQLKAKRYDPSDSATQREKTDFKGTTGLSSEGLYLLIEIWGKFEIPPAEGTENVEPEFADLILTFGLDDRRLHRKIRNPYFGAPKHIVRIPYLHQPHEIEGMGAAEQVAQFQEEASTAHNQVIDAATAAIAGIVVRKPSAKPLTGMEIYPGAEIVADDPQKDFAVVHLSMGNSTLPNVEQQAAFWAEKRSGYSAYSMGVESPIAGSRATATGTTALISEGSQRFWVSIDDLRDAIVDILYLCLQLEQQLRPEGTPITGDRVLILPQGDLRSLIGLNLQVSSEKVNRDLEVQNLQLLITILNDYFARLMQAAAMIMNPAFPPGQKMMALMVMDASNKLMKRLVERFDIQNVDEIVPSLNQALQMIGGALGPQAMAVPPALPPGGAPQPSQGGPGGGAPPAGPGGGPQ